MFHNPGDDWHRGCGVDPNDNCSTETSHLNLAGGIGTSAFHLLLGRHQLDFYVGETPLHHPKTRP